MATYQLATVTVKPRVKVFVEEILSTSEIPPAFKGPVKKMITAYLDKMTDEDIRKILLTARDEILPFLLGEK